MDAVQAIVLGIVQGLTEFLPVSSTAHLRIVPAFLGWEDPGAAFTAVIQLGTMAAVLLYFRADLWRIARDLAARACARPELRSELDARMGWYIILGTIPIGIFGLAFADQIESGARDLYLIGTTLIVLGLLLLLAERVGKRERSIEDITRRDGIVIGFAPGAARSSRASRARARRSPPACSSASTASRPPASRSCSRSRPSCSRASSSCARSARRAAPASAPTILATICAFVVGYASIAFLLRWLARHSTAVFVAYRVALGALVLALAGRGRHRLTAASSSAAASRRSRVLEALLEASRRPPRRRRAPRRRRPGSGEQPREVGRDPQLQRRPSPARARAPARGAATPRPRSASPGDRVQRAVEPVQLGLVEQRALAARQLQRLGDGGEAGLGVAARAGGRRPAARGSAGRPCARRSPRERAPGPPLISRTPCVGSPSSASAQPRSTRPIASR